MYAWNCHNETPYFVQYINAKKKTLLDKRAIVFPSNADFQIGLKRFRTYLDMVCLTHGNWKPDKLVSTVLNAHKYKFLVDQMPKDH